MEIDIAFTAFVFDDSICATIEFGTPAISYTSFGRCRQQSKVEFFNFSNLFCPCKTAITIQRHFEDVDDVKVRSLLLQVIAFGV